MSWTKKQIIEEAFAELALAGYVFDLTPDELQTALRRLDSMMGTWDGMGLRVGYSGASTVGASNLEDDSGLPDGATEAVYQNLALRLAPTFGKQIPPATQIAAKEGLKRLMWRAAMPQEMQFPNTLPRGAGTKPWRTTNNQFMPTVDTDPLRNTQGDNIEVLPE